MLKKNFIFISYLLILFMLQGCAVQRHRKLQRFLDTSISKAHFEQQFTGILVLDPVSGDTLYAHNSQKYFTPASNAKLFTLYAGLKLLPDSIPALRYISLNDTLYVQGTGDPSQLHPYFRDSTVLHFLKPYPQVALYSQNFTEPPWAPGWAWEDYDGPYAPERSALPLYGNVVEVFNQDGLQVSPGYFRDSVNALRYPSKRLQDANLFFADPGRQDTLLIPFKTDSTLTRQLLEQALGRPVSFAPRLPRGDRKTLYSLPADSLYQRMMQESDNFLAEQLLLAASSTLSDTLSSEKARAYVLGNFLKDLRQPPLWVDGSGLSRYNLFSPESLVYVLHRMYEEVPRERLFAIFPAGGVSGTLKEWYAGDREPYIFAKTGTLSNNLCLSGYLQTRSGNLLIFSFMNNHFRQPSLEIKEGMRRVFEWLRDTY